MQVESEESLSSEELAHKMKIAVALAKERWDDIFIAIKTCVYPRTLGNHLMWR